MLSLPWKKISDKLASFFVYAFTFILLGASIGMYISTKYVEKRIDEAIKVGGFLHKDKVYKISRDYPIIQNTTPENKPETNKQDKGAQK